jgi:hypothetical protein
MARPTQQEIDEFNARMNEPEESDSDDFEVVLFDDSGNPVGTMPFAKAKSYFRKRGIDLDDDGTITDINADGGQSDSGQGNKPKGSNSGMAAPTAPATRTSSKYFAGKNARTATVQPAGTGIDPNSQPGDPSGNPPR